MRRYRLGAHTKDGFEGTFDLDTEVPEAGTGGAGCSTSAGYILRRVAMEHELEVFTGKVAVDHVHMFIGYRPTHSISKIVQWLKGTSSRVMLQEFTHLRK